MPVASEKIAVDLARRRPGRPGAAGVVGVAPGSAVSPGPEVVVIRRTIRGCAAGAARALVPSARPQERAFSRHAEHQATAEARPDRGRGAAREPALSLDDQDADEAPVVGGRGRRHGDGRDRAQEPREVDRPRRRARGAPPQHGSAQEVPGGADRLPPRLVAPAASLPRLPPSSRRAVAGLSRYAWWADAGSRGRVISISARSSSRSAARREPPLSAWSSRARRVVTSRSSSGL